MKVLVTGGGGFLGRYIVEQLVARGDQVRTLARAQYAELEAIGAETIQGDIRNPESVLTACAGVDAVIHTAAVAGIWGSWKHFYEINTLGTRHVVDACRQHGIERLIYCSSPSVTFDGSDQVNVDESAPYPRRWLCHYSHTKALAEQHVLQANGQGGLLTCALRPHLIWGPRDQHLIPRLVDRARRGKLVCVGAGNNLIDMIYVENAATAHIQALDALSAGSPVCGKAYFISQGQPVNCWQWINEILELVNLPPVRRAISFRTAWNVGAALEAAYTALRINSEPRMTRFLAAQLAKHHYFDISRAQKDLGYRASTPTADGMKRLGEWLNRESFPHLATQRLPA